MPTSKASAVWKGGLRGGTGEFSAGSGAFAGAYSFPTRFEGAAGTNPEELIAAAHAACLSMALAAGLERGGTPPESITTTAHCSLEKLEEGFRIKECQPIRVDGIEHDVRFKKPSLESLMGKTVRLYIMVQDADLYGFRFK